MLLDEFRLTCPATLLRLRPSLSKHQVAQLFEPCFCLQLLIPKPHPAFDTVPDVGHAAAASFAMVTLYVPPLPGVPRATQS